MPPAPRLAVTCSHALVASRAASNQTLFGPLASIIPPPADATGRHCHGTKPRMSHIRSRKHAPGQRPLVTASLLTGLALAATGMAHAEAPVADASGASDAKTLDKLDVHGERVKRYQVKQSASDKYTKPLQDTPQTIQVISSDLFNEQGATTLTEALRNTPGVGTFYVGENGNTSTGDSVYMRGFDTSSSIFVDGIRDLGTVSRDVFNVDQIEVLKGPAGTDTGRSAASGAINMITKQAHVGQSVSGTVTGGNDGQRRATADWNQPLGGEGSGAALRLNGMWQDSDVPGRDHVNNKRWGLAPSLAFGLGSATRYYLDLYYLKQENIPDGGVPTIGLPGWQPQPGLEQLAGHPVDPENFYGTRADHDNSKSQMATFRFEHDFSDNIRLANTARWGKTTQDYLLTAFMSTGGTTANPLAGNIKWTDISDLSTYTLARSLPTYKDQKNTILTDQLNLHLDLDTGSVQHAISTGLEFAREEQHNYGLATTSGSGWPAASLYNPDWNVSGLSWGHSGADTRGRTTTYSAYFFDTLTFNDSFMVTAGLRADHYKTEYHSLVVCGSGRQPVPCGTQPTGSLVTGVDDDASDTLLNWKLGAVYKIDDTVSLYADYAQSQQPPGGANFELSNAANSANNPNMDPQKARTLEVGTKWNVLDALAVNVALFRTTVTNEITGSAAEGYFQNGEKRVQGVEISAVGNITDNWQVSAGYTSLSTSVVTGAVVTADGTYNLTYTPDKAFTSWTTYRFPFGLTVGGGVRYSGQMHRGTDGAVGTPAYTKSYTVYDAVVSYDITDNIALRLNGYNLFDKEYVAAINKSGYRYTPGTPRTFLLSADFRF